MAPHEKTELRGMNAFTSVRPRAKDMPAKLPTQRKPAHPITINGTTRVLSINGRRMAKLEPSPNSIVIESREQAQASNDKTRRISKAGTK